MKKFVLFIFAILFVFPLTGCGQKASYEDKNITINVYDKESKLIYNSKITTKEEKLSDAIDNLEGLDVKFEDSDYGKFIISMEGITQGDDYYWNYYINSKYATVGVSSCVIDDGATYDFRIEKFE